MHATGMVAHACNPNTQEAEAGGLPSSLRPSWTSSEDHVMEKPSAHSKLFLTSTGTNSF
ncbi:rCG60645 [Rattus norvegicus]|uniref:RCG60645 n=1 Tax=Rattus norvegicus TaxID=10116 RepID=A6JKC6_RAT|nr:rCG60645 [Rattus norvegicus]